MKYLSFDIGIKKLTLIFDGLGDLGLELGEVGLVGFVVGVELGQNCLLHPLQLAQTHLRLDQPGSDQQGSDPGYRQSRPLVWSQL